jgi:hypothetical protein
MNELFDVPFGFIGAGQIATGGAENTRPKEQISL